MAVYEYKATDLDAGQVAGTILADTPRAARDQLRGKGLSPTTVKPIARRRRLRRRAGRKVQTEVAALIRELATLLKAGIPLLPALRTLSGQHGRRLGPVIQELAEAVAAGSNLAEAMERRSEYFDTLCTSIVAVGESTGSLETALLRLAEFKEKSLQLRSRLTTALLYPVFVLAIGLAVTIFLMTYVVPNLLASLDRAGKDLPAITVAVQTASNLLIDWWPLLAAGAVGLIVAIRLAVATERGRFWADRAILATPVLGELVRKENVSRLSVVLAALLKSGLPFTEALRITRSTLRNRVFRRALEQYQRAVMAGADVAGPLEQSGVFRPMVVQMLAVGQQTGELEEMLDQLAEAYDQQVATAAARLTALLEPLLIVILAVLVGVIALATILPILEASNVL
jgi:type II secretory pathway component PulF